MITNDSDNAYRPYVIDQVEMLLRPPYNLN